MEKVLSVTVRRTIVKQHYVNSEPVFKEDAIGVPRDLIYQFINQKAATDTVSYWNRLGKPNYNYEIVKTEITDRDFSKSLFFDAHSVIED
jgi:hypothetical protein